MPAISPAELRRILDKLGITLAELARLCQVHPVSARRWGSTGVPDGPAVVLIHLLAAGKVSARTIEQVSKTDNPHEIPSRYRAHRTLVLSVDLERRAKAVAINLKKSLHHCDAGSFYRWHRGHPSA